MRRSLNALFASFDKDRSALKRSAVLRRELVCLSNDQIRAIATRTKDMLQFMAAATVVASRILGQDMYDVQLRGSLALARGSIAEMQTGEGKTLAAVPAAAWLARGGKGLHVMTVNDYLARRDASWMGDIYRTLGLSVGHVQQGMAPVERRAAYACDVTYATANEIGFDLLRDRLALRLDQQVHRPFSVAVIDEVDSILIDEARIPLVIAGGSTGEDSLVYRADQVVRRLRPVAHYTLDTGNRNAALTDAGIRAVEDAFGCGNFFEERNLRLHTVLQDSLEAHALLRRDVDYLVKDGAIEMVDELKGRVAMDRRWPAGLHTAVEAKEGVSAKAQGMVLGSTKIQQLVALYPQVCGMTGTAFTQALEFQTVYGLPVEQIPTHRAMIRIDHPDILFRTKVEKELAVANEVRRVHATGQPILVGTASVEESERLSDMLAGVPHSVLNARNDEVEADVISRAGQFGAVTVSTNMAGRGTDIQLGENVAALGGLYVIGTNRHESRRIDNQLRGRAGRQGDPGCSRFFISTEDPLLQKYGDLNPRYKNDPSSIQRLVEGQHLNQRQYLQRYDVPLEGQRNRIHTHRQAVLDGSFPTESDLEQQIALRTIDDLWADYLARLEDFRTGIPWHSYVAIPGFFVGTDWRDPHFTYLRQIDEWFPELEASIPVEVSRRLAEAEAGGTDSLGDRGAVWTYLTTDQPFGAWTERLLKGIQRKFSSNTPVG